MALKVASPFKPKETRRQPTRCVGQHGKQTNKLTNKQSRKTQQISKQRLFNQTIKQVSEHTDYKPTDQTKQGKPKRFDSFSPTCAIWPKLSATPSFSRRCSMAAISFAWRRRQATPDFGWRDGWGVEGGLGGGRGGGGGEDLGPWCRTVRLLNLKVVQHLTA